MSKNEKSLLTKNMDRRSFVVGGVATALAGVVTGGELLNSPKVANATPEPVWDGEADVVVLGFGAAGGTAACKAIADGLSVLVLESTSVPGGTTRVSGGAFYVPCTSVTAESGYTDSPELARTYLAKINGGAVDDELVDTMLYDGPKMIDFIRSEVHLPLAVFKGLPEYHSDWEGAIKYGRSYVTTYKNKKAPEALMSGFYDYAVAKGVRFVFNCHADGLIQDADDRVIGVKALDIESNKRVQVKAKKGVIIATGGIEWDDYAKKTFWRGPAEVTTCFPPNDGSALRMVQGVGAQLANMNELFGTCGYLEDGWEAEVADYRKNIKKYRTTTWEKITGDYVTWRGKPGAIVVNRYGQRFFNEACDYDTAVNAFHAKESFGDCGWRNVPAFTIMDTEAFNKYGLGNFPGADGKVTPRSFVKSADTLEGLAEIFGIEPAGLVAAVKVFNANAAEGKDPDFHRGEHYFDRIGCGDAAVSAKNPNDPRATLRPLGAGPYYGAQLHPMSVGACAGPRVNGKGQVYHATGVLIKGLYAAGNAAGVGGPGVSYAGPGGTIGPAMVFGYAAAADIARQK